MVLAELRIFGRGTRVATVLERDMDNRLIEERT